MKNKKTAKPLPTPNAGEDEGEFIARCNRQLADEYTDEDQRNAICYEQWRDGKTLRHAAVLVAKDAFKAARKDKEGKPVYRIVASTADVDRDGEIVLPASFFNLADYLAKNPVILFGHDHYSRPPIGKAVGGEINETGLLLDIQFADTPFAQEIEELYKGGYMNAFSVGFIPVDWEVGKEGQRIFTKCELLEVSAVPVPSNRAAVIMRAAGLKDGSPLQEYYRALGRAKKTESVEAPGSPDGEEPKEPKPERESLATRVAELWEREHKPRPIFRTRKTR